MSVIPSLLHFQFQSFALLLLLLAHLLDGLHGGLHGIAADYPQNLVANARIHPPSAEGQTGPLSGSSSFRNAAITYGSMAVIVMDVQHPTATLAAQ